LSSAGRNEEPSDNLFLFPRLRACVLTDDDQTSCGR
jgi:hypothetical protein